jgi:hypothetical protein
MISCVPNFDNNNIVCAYYDENISQFVILTKKYNYFYSTNISSSITIEDDYESYTKEAHVFRYSVDSQSLDRTVDSQSLDRSPFEEEIALNGNSQEKALKRFSRESVSRKESVPREEPVERSFDKQFLDESPFEEEKAINRNSQEKALKSFSREESAKEVYIYSFKDSSTRLFDVYSLDKQTSTRKTVLSNVLDFSVIENFYVFVDQNKTISMRYRDSSLEDIIYQEIVGEKIFIEENLLFVFKNIIHVDNGYQAVIYQYDIVDGSSIDYSSQKVFAMLPENFKIREFKIIHSRLILLRDDDIKFFNINRFDIENNFEIFAVNNYKCYMSENVYYKVADDRSIKRIVINSADISESLFEVSLLIVF